jgi:hypothetical protein
MKERVGTFTGIPVYKTTKTEYIYKQLYLDDNVIYLIDDQMIKDNEVFADYDGKYVHEYDIKDRGIYYNIPIAGMKTANFSKTELENSLAIEKNIDEIIANAYVGVCINSTTADQILKGALET